MTRHAVRASESIQKHENEKISETLIERAIHVRDAM